MELTIPIGTATINSSIATAIMAGRKIRISRIRKLVPNISEHHSHNSSIFSIGVRIR